VFSDQKQTVEDYMKERGQLVRKGTLSEDGDLEFWEDGTTTARKDKKPDNTTAAWRDTKFDHREKSDSNIKPEE